ncbi:unnamed protein product [Penicillium olsonii]|nr:unnamed protein product [Penicillium olsonii]
MGTSVSSRLGRILALFILCLLIIQAAGQDCSKDISCATGCCSKNGYCGTGDDFCGADCVGTCDYKLGCDANNPCERGCCNKFGFCGLGPDFCGDDCVASCEKKAECDPGFGSEWSEKSSCPLNTCCSKFGFCGTTSEFCGKKKVKRPSCDKSSHTLERVVGYYETWSIRRRCQKRFWPERIPYGVYTHINVAYALIDPTSFEIIPSLTADIALFSRVTHLKRSDPGLKVFIAIGGWTYNNPGPSATTFSDLAASESNQMKFFSSLTKFLFKYDFDGVDIDWEYPGADDRGGRPQDFTNFPRFLKNLKDALKRTGGRDGLSITLPASFWYLQHFDIQNMKKSVDFFNIMTYDLHGTWDKGNQWTGDSLDAHTNLTEIQLSLDLLWRNNIPSDQVVLGLAFYGRAYTIADPACTEPGCLFVSGAEAGKCSSEIGVLMNSEIDEVIVSKRPTVTWDKRAAVKMMTWDGDQLVTFDDADTFKQKADFARSQCLGGLTVWAVSHDHTNGTFSQALGEAAERKFEELPDYIETEDTIKIKHGQCKWTNCGELCPAGWVLLKRQDNDKTHDGDWMLDDGGCPFKGDLRRLCCPPDQEAFQCGWYNFNNGACDGKCPSGMFEFGETDRECSTASWNYQAACCTTGQKSFIRM